MKGSFLQFPRLSGEELGDVRWEQVAIGFASRLLPQLSFPRTRTAVLRSLGLRIGSHSVVLGAIRITGNGNIERLISIGAEVVITGPLHVEIGAEVHVGNRVFLGHDVTLNTAVDRTRSTLRRSAQSSVAPIVIGDGAWLASRVMVMPGVTIGAGAVIGAGSVVTEDVPPNVLAAGSPARVLRALDDPPPSVPPLSQLPR